MHTEVQYKLKKIKTNTSKIINFLYKINLKLKCVRNLSPTLLADVHLYATFCKYSDPELGSNYSQISIFPIRYCHNRKIYRTFDPEGNNSLIFALSEL